MARTMMAGGIAVAAILVLGVTASWSQTGQGSFSSWNAAPPHTIGNAAMLMSATQLPTGHQQTILIDTANRTMAVYHIQYDTGVISLRSVRRMDADFGLEEFNNADPSPSKVRSVLTVPRS